MNRTRPVFRFVLPLLLLCTAAIAHSQTGLLITQIYGGGGNSGGTYNADFVEIYNPTSSPISTAGLSVQYASAAGNFTQALPLTTATIQPGHYFLVQTTTSSTTLGVALPTPDTSGTAPNMSATAGKVALVNGTTALSGDTTCTAILSDAAIIDMVGYGSSTNVPSCYKGTSYAAGPSTTSTNTQSIIRTVSGTNTNNNAADFTIASPPTPRNSSYGSSGTSLSGVGTATPSSLTSGDTTLLTVTVTPASSPASTSIAVTANLTGIGGAASQQFYDDGTHGDGTAGDNIFSFSTTATVSTSGAVSFPATVIDAQSNTATASISLTINVPAINFEIHDIQGVKSTTAMTVSPYVGQRVVTTGVVTAVLPNGFFIQSQNPDANPLTPEGIDVFTSSAPPAAAAIGNVVTVTGTVSTFPAVTASHTPATEITGTPTVILVSTGATLPAPITITPSMLTPGGGLYQLTPYEGMRVTFTSITAVSGTNGSITDANEPAELATSTGHFYGVIGNTARPFREPGIDIRDPFTPLPSAVAHFDDNPERILVDTTIAGGTSLEISTGAVLPNPTGVLDFTFSSDSFFDPSRLILDKSYDRTQVTAGMTPQPVLSASATQFTVASFNIERFYNTSNTDNLYYVPAGVNNSTSGRTATSQAATLTTSAYTRRLQKVSLAIRNVLKLPDIVTLEEVENQTVATDIANQVNTDAGVPNLYTAYGTDNSTSYTQDGTGISVGFLIKSSAVDNLGITQFGQNEIFTPSTSTNPITLNDRPWLVLKAGIKRTNAKDYPVSIIANHMKALSGVDSTTSTSTRQKKELQAEDIAKYIQTLQASGQHVISGGDFNAFEFSDGYTDTLATYTNTNILPATQVVQPGVAGLVTPPLVDLALQLPATQRWSYVEDGSAQILDHMVVTPELVTAGAQLVYAHFNADFPVTAYNDATTPARTSDHDVPVGYFTIPAPVLSGTVTPATTNAFAATAVGATSAGQNFVFTNSGEGPVTIASVTTTGDFSAGTNCNSTTVAINATCTVNVVFKPTAGGTRNGSITFNTNISGQTFTRSLTGTAQDFTMLDSAGSATTSVNVPAGSKADIPLTFTAVGGFTGTVTITCTPPSFAPTGVTCTPPAAFTLGSTPTIQIVTFSTTSRTASAGVTGTSTPTVVISFFVLGSGFLLLITRRRNVAVTLSGVLFLMLAAITVVSAGGCSSGHSATSNPNGTPVGTYTYTVTATSGSVTHSETINLSVQ